MITYILLFNFPLILYYFELKKKIIFDDLLKFYFLFLFFFISLRYEVGGDFYSTSLSMLPLTSFYETFSTITILNSILLYIAKLSSLDVFFYNSVASFIFCSIFYVFIKEFNNRSLILLISFPIIILILAMGFTKQSIAFSFIILGILNFVREKYLIAVFLFCVSILFHISSIIIFAIFLYKIKYFIKKIYTYFFLLFILALLYFYFEVIHEYILNWIIEDARPKSGGTILRVLINLPVILIYVLNRSNILKINKNYSFLDIILSIQFLIFILAYLTNLSGLLDRFNIILSFSQIIVYSLIFQIHKKFILEISLFIYIKYSILLLLWLTLADTRFAWIPYKNILFSNF